MNVYYVQLKHIIIKQDPRLKMIVSFVQNTMFSTTRPPTGKVTENTRAAAISAKTVQPSTSVLIPESAKRLLPSTFGMITLSWQRMHAIPLTTRLCTKSVRRKSSASLPMPKKNMQCVILRSEALLKLPTGSGLSLLP